MEVFAKIPFQYGTQQLERGEVLMLRNLPRDNQLVALKYLIQFDAREHDKQTCPDCGKVFSGYSYLLGHRRKPNCLAASPEITIEETAELIGANPETTKIT